MAASPQGSLPTFIGIGAMKAGTTSLFGFLSDHDDVFMADPKELDFFLDRGSWDHGLDWYKGHFVDVDGFRAFGEISPSYGQTHLYPEVPERISRVVPNARLILLVREPVARIRSMYSHMHIDGLEKLPINEAVFANTDYIETSRYIRHLEAFEAWFPRSQILVCVSERLRANPLRTLDEIARFIGVQTWSSLGLDVADDRNVTEQRVVESTGGRWLRDRPVYWQALSRSWRLREAHRRIFEHRAAVPKTDLRPDVERSIREMLADDTAALEDWLGYPIEEWHTPNSWGTRA